MDLKRNENKQAAVRIANVETVKDTAYALSKISNVLRNQRPIFIEAVCLTLIKIWVVKIHLQNYRIKTI